MHFAHQHQVPRLRTISGPLKQMVIAQGHLSVALRAMCCPPRMGSASNPGCECSNKLAPCPTPHSRAVNLTSSGVSGIDATICNGGSTAPVPGEAFGHPPLKTCLLARACSCPLAPTHLVDVQGRAVNSAHGILVVAAEVAA